MNPSFERCFCVLPNLDGSSLLVQVRDEGLDIPSFELPRNRLDFFPDQVIQIREAVRREIGAEVTVRRHLHSGSDNQICLLELQAPLNSCPDGFRWIDTREAEHVWADPVSAEAWVLGLRALQSERRRAPWEELGWYRSASEWILEQLDRLSYRPTGSIEQIKGAWGWSSLLRVDTDRGHLYFKACYPRPPFEADLLPRLAELWPANMPRVVAADSERNWTLIAEFSGINLEPLGMDLHARALTKFAELQRESADQMPRWRKAGVRDMSPVALLTELQLNEAAYSRIEDLMPRIRELLQRLANSPIPLVLANEDFRAGNIHVVGDDFLYFDWAFGVIAHPFFGLNYFLNRMIRDPQIDGFRWRVELNEARRTLRDAYLAQWTEYASMDRLVEEFWICRRLYYLYDAIFSVTDAIYLDADAPWTQGCFDHLDNCLQSLPKALAIIDALDPD